MITERVQAAIVKYKEIVTSWALIVVLVLGGAGIGSFITSYNNKSDDAIKTAQHLSEVNRLQSLLMFTLNDLTPKVEMAVDRAFVAASIASQAARDSTENAIVSQKRSEINMKELRKGMAKTQAAKIPTKEATDASKEASRSKLNNLVESSNTQIRK